MRLRLARFLIFPAFTIAVCGCRPAPVGVDEPVAPAEQFNVPETCEDDAASAMDWALGEWQLVLLPESGAPRLALQLAVTSVEVGAVAQLSVVDTGAVETVHLAASGRDRFTLQSQASASVSPMLAMELRRDGHRLVGAFGRETTAPAGTELGAVFGAPRGIAVNASWPRLACEIRCDISNAPFRHHDERCVDPGNPNSCDTVLFDTSNTTMLCLEQACGPMLASDIRTVLDSPVPELARVHLERAAKLLSVAPDRVLSARELREVQLLLGKAAASGAAVEDVAVGVAGARSLLAL